MADDTVGHLAEVGLDARHVGHKPSSGSHQHGACGTPLVPWPNGFRPDNSSFCGICYSIAFRLN